MEVPVRDEVTFRSSHGGPSRRQLAATTWRIQPESIEGTTASMPQVGRAEARTPPGGGFVPYADRVVHGGLQLRRHAKPGLGSDKPHYPRVQRQPLRILSSATITVCWSV
jgi:hypothetical protein